jgi:hypothetical protein
MQAMTAHKRSPKEAAVVRAINRNEYCNNFAARLNVNGVNGVGHHLLFFIPIAIKPGVFVKLGITILSIGKLIHRTQERHRQEVE